MTASPTPNNTPPPKSARRKKWLAGLCIVLAFFLTVGLTLVIMTKIGEAKLRQDLVHDETVEGEDTFDETAIYHNGKAYHYNDELINLLLIGIDHDDDSKKSQQADALYLLSINQSDKTIRIISISRNTMCDFNTLDVNGNAYGTDHKQICLSYAYGVSPDNAAKNTVLAVSNLLYDIPINGYYALHMDTVKDLVQLIGGVKVTVPRDITAPSLMDKRGKTVRLNGDEALDFLQARGDSNAPRVERQKQFIAAYKTAAAERLKRDVSLPVKLLNKLSKNASTNLDLSGMMYLATEALGWPMEFINVPGTYSIQDGLEAYTVDETALKTIILDNFYVASGDIE